MEKHFFVDDQGDLRDTRVENWHTLPPLRANFKRPHQRIESVADLKATLRYGSYTSFGCYPLFFITSDGEAMSFKAAREEFRQIVENWDTPHAGWRIVGCEINYEDNDLFCCHTNEKIEFAYGEDEPEEDAA